MNQALHRLAASRSALVSGVEAQQTNWPIRRRPAAGPRGMGRGQTASWIQADESSGAAAPAAAPPLRELGRQISPAAQGQRGWPASDAQPTPCVSPSAAPVLAGARPHPTQVPGPTDRGRRRSTRAWLWAALGLLLGAGGRLLWIWGNA